MSWQATIVGGLVWMLAVTSWSAAAAQAPAAPHPEDSIVSELMVTAPAAGPAWWKVSKGDASVWIFGLPPKTPHGFDWDQSTFKRRIKGARLMLMPYVESSGYDPAISPSDLNPDLARQVAVEGRRLGQPMGSIARSGGRAFTQRMNDDGQLEWEPTGVGREFPRLTTAHALHLRGIYFRRWRLSFSPLDDVRNLARDAGVPVVTPPVYSHRWNARTLAPDRPETTRCIQAIFAEVRESPEHYRQAARFWAAGNVRAMLDVAPKGNRGCEQLWPGHWERTVAFQTSLIAQALDRPGKVIATAHIGQLVAENGILQRLQAQGYTIADPSLPLEEVQ